MLAKQPFQDKLGRWWIYRSDDPNMHRPLGPFFTPDYAADIERMVRNSDAPMPSAFGPQPAVQYTYMED